MQRVSVFNICSEAIDMLKFSTKYAIENAGTDFDYILILWNPSKEVEEWAVDENIIYYMTDDKLSFIQNLRNCFNMGFNRGFELNDYTCGINTDMAFSKNWLLNLIKYAREDAIINCTQVEPGPGIHQKANFGVPGRNFDLESFYMYCNTIFQDKLVTEEELGRRADATPHLMHKSVWKKFGLWNVKLENPPADVDFFNRCKAGGIKNLKSLGSIVYHASGIETRERRK